MNVSGIAADDIQFFRRSVMKNIEKNFSTKLPQQKLEAPVALTPDQIAKVAAGASLSSVASSKIIFGGMPAGPILAAKGQTQA
jgi:hypothetical protein